MASINGNYVSIYGIELHVIPCGSWLWHAMRTAAECVTHLMVIRVVTLS